MNPITDRIVEAYIGEYASGKSENAVNRALELRRMERKVTLVDLDLVEPFYTLRPIKKELEEQGLTVVAWETKETMGLGEAGNVIKPEMRWVLRREGDIILDIGYGINGSKVFRILEEVEKEKNFRIYAVVNVARPMTSNLAEIVEYVKELGTVHGLINNSHFGDETNLDIIQQGVDIVSDAAKELGIPVIATAVERSYADKFGKTDSRGNPIRVLDRVMQRTFW